MVGFVEMVFYFFVFMEIGDDDELVGVGFKWDDGDFGWECFVVCVCVFGFVGCVLRNVCMGEFVGGEEGVGVVVGYFNGVEVEEVCEGVIVLGDVFGGVD